MPSNYNPYRTSWTDNPLRNATEASPHHIRKIHIDDLRNGIDINLSLRGGVARTWSEPIVVSSTQVRSTHVNELRTAVQAFAALVNPCTTNTVTVAFTAPNPLVANVDYARSVHIQELRNLVTGLEAACYCDCVGHCNCVSHTYCSCAGMAHCCCEGHCSGPS
jgi:hypothetical protein